MASSNFDICLVLISAFFFAGIMQVLWLKHPLFKKLAWPIDMGYHWQGRPIFGKNKTVAGFLVMVPATMLAFMLWGVLLRYFPRAVFSTSSWPQEILGWGYLGSLAGLGYMLGELPNSFIKRRLNIAPGTVPSARNKWVYILIDQIDSVIGALLAIALVVPLKPLLALWLVVLAGIIHWGFNYLLFVLHVKRVPY